MILQSHQSHEHDVAEFALLRAGLLRLLEEEHKNGGMEHAFWDVVGQTARTMAQIAKRVNEHGADNDNRN